MADAKQFVSQRPHLVPALVAAAMLLAALGRWPYDYYRVLRWVICAAAAFMAYRGYVCRKPWAIWFFMFVAVIFNPIVRFHLSRQTWQILDSASAVAFIAGAVTITKPVLKAETGREP